MFGKIRSNNKIDVVETLMLEHYFFYKNSSTCLFTNSKTNKKFFQTSFNKL